jgi:polar amino acid transport system permease protein
MFNFAFALSILPQLAEAAVTTLAVTLASFFLALVIGVPLALLRRAKWPLLARATTIIVDFVRCTPILVQLYFLYFALPGFGIRLSPLATGLLAFSLHYGCYMSEVYRAGLEAVPRGQWDACVALSLSLPGDLLVDHLPAGDQADHPGRRQLSGAYVQGDPVARLDLGRGDDVRIG